MKMHKKTADELRELYPVSAIYTPLDGYDIQRTDKRITALVVVQDERGGRDLRFYSWMKKRTGPEDGTEGSENAGTGYSWKVDLARHSAVHWDLSKMARQGRLLARKYNVKMDEF